MTNLGSTLKSRDIILLTKVHLVKAIIFPVVMYGCESWIIKKAEHQIIDAFELWCWRRLQGDQTSPSYRRSVLGVHWKDWCWSWNSNTLATWCEELTHWKRPWCWERLKAGGEGDNREWDGWMASQTLWTWVWASARSWWWTGKPGVLQSMGSQTRTWLSSRTELREVFPKEKKENCLSSGFKVSLESRKTHMREAEGCLCWKVWRWRITHWVRGTTRVWTDCKRSFRGSVRWGREPGHAGCYKSSLWGLKCLTGSSGSGIGPVSVIVMKWASKL